MEKVTRNKMWHEYNTKHPYNKLRSLKDPAIKSEIEKWYKILEDDGFIDVERNQKMSRISGERSIPSFLAPKKPASVLAKQNYYASWATYFVHHENLFTSTYDALIHEAMGEGFTFRQIQSLLKSKGFTKNIAVSTIRERVKDWEEYIISWNKINANGVFYVPPNNVWRNEHSSRLLRKARKKGNS